MNIENITKDLEQTKSSIVNSPPQKVRYISNRGEESCEKCRANHNKIFDLDDVTLPKLPIHPNCRCRYETINNTKQDISVEVELYKIAKNLNKQQNLKIESKNKISSQIINARQESNIIKEQNIFLLFNGQNLVSSDGTLALDAVSGKPINVDEKITSRSSTGLVSSHTNMTFDYSARRQREKGEGGIPCGVYFLKPKEERSGLTSPYSHIIKYSGWGNFSWSLHPDEKTVLHDRSGFFVHGGTQFGSAGCIDILDGDIKLKQYLNKLKINKIYIYVKYDDEIVNIEYDKTYREKNFFDDNFDF